MGSLHDKSDVESALASATLATSGEREVAKNAKMTRLSSPKSDAKEFILSFTVILSAAKDLGVR